jgi:hypothetical protein
VDVSSIPTFKRRSSLGALVAVAAAAVLMIWAPAALARPSLYAVSKETACLANQNVNPFLRANHASVMRLILSPQAAPIAAGIGCVEAARAAGFKVYISFQFNNHWTPGQVAAYFARVLPTYAPYVWAVGVGNEQDLAMSGTYGQGTVSLTRDGRSAGQNYRAVWNAVEPVLVRLAPHAIRVYGEFSPWGFGSTQVGFAHGRPPGVQAIAAHCYHTKFDGLAQVPQDAAWAASKGLPLWCSEMGPAFPSRTMPKWAVPDSWPSWKALVGKVVARSPDLKMWGYYYDPAM